MKKFNYVIKSIFIGFFAGIINGLFGSGGGAIIVPSLTLLLGLTHHKAHATSLLIILPFSIISFIIYYNNQYADIGITFKVSFGGIIGAYFGAKALNKIPNSYLKRIFGICLCIVAIRMVF